MDPLHDIEATVRRMGPLAADHPLVASHECPGCNGPFAAGEYVTLVPIGPGDDEIARESCRAGRPYNAVSVPAHWACVTGES